MITAIVLTLGLGVLSFCLEKILITPQSKDNAYLVGSVIFALATFASIYIIIYNS